MLYTKIDCLHKELSEWHGILGKCQNFVDSKQKWDRWNGMEVILSINKCRSTAVDM
jgi:hypothetical protein